MLRSFLVILFFSCCAMAVAQFPSAPIPAGLADNASAIVRYSEREIILRDKGNVLIRNHYVYTILNSGGNDYAKLILPYDKLKKVLSIEGTLFDAEGKKLRSLRKSEIKDYSNTSEDNLADDDRVKLHNFDHSVYPYSVEYETAIEMDGLFYLPAWTPVFNENIAVQAASLQVITEPGYELRFKAYNYAQAPIITSVKKDKKYSWAVANIAPVKDEAYSPAWHEMVPTVFIAPSSFEMQKYAGSMNNWNEFGTFIYTLNANRNVLPEQVKQKVHALTNGLATDKQKITVLYKYLQQNTRYISIQLGIGGWQTLDAGFVASKGYGDCKALSNYMNALLTEAGIPSHIALVKAGSDEASIIPDFSSNQFNHVIVCVPQPKDSIWLECTSQTSQPGYMGSFTGNRHALLISEKGGTLVRTPYYGAPDNVQKRIIKAAIDEKGGLNATVTSNYSGMQQDRLDGAIKQLSTTQFADYMKRKFDLPSYEVVDFSHSVNTAALPSIEEKVTLKVAHYASVTGKRLFVNPNLLSVSSFKIKDAANRKFDFEFKIPFIDTDSVEIEIPAGYKAEAVPTAVDIRSGTSIYKSSLKIAGQKIIFTRYYSQQPQRSSPANIKELADFFEKVYKADHSKIVFVKESA
ncbi:MAG: DUF3857 domain-containing protein [Rhizobacter sp.]|nr:DUF3857 domain-containing protein [Ferruginibacter sp.]